MGDIRTGITPSILNPLATEKEGERKTIISVFRNQSHRPKKGNLTAWHHVPLRRWGHGGGIRYTGEEKN